VYNVPVLGHLPEVSRIDHGPTMNAHNHNECSQAHLGIRTSPISETRHSAS
jgi:hypothetical protein